MVIIIPIIMAAMALVAVIAVGSVMLALSATAMAFNAVDKTATSRIIRLVIFAGGAFGFIYGWTGVGPVTHDGAEGLFEWIIKITVSLLCASVVLGAAALSLRLSQVIVDRIKINPYLSAAVGMALGLGALVLIEDQYLQWEEGPPPIALYRDGEPTHCVWREVRLYKSQAHRQHRPDRYVIKLNQGDQIRLDPNVRLTHERFTVKFRIVQSKRVIDLYGKSTDFRLIKDADQNCQW